MARANSELVQYYISTLSRDRIFPPFFNDPETLVPDVAGNRRPPRPLNAFLLLRKNVAEEARRCIDHPNMRVISKVSSILWANSTQEEKDVYQCLAKDVSRLHAIRFPDFTYTVPRRQLSFRPYCGPPSLPESDCTPGPSSMTTFMPQVEHTRNLMTPPPSPPLYTHVLSGELPTDYVSVNDFQPEIYAFIDMDSELYPYVANPYTITQMF
ncbi:9519_t:CDS:1 [Paraglomus occultum]|uniref:9519_t:CDS:1 n=1 Tax=Paraglomus occultum TaxID=144539 RepID=A0A9N8ZIC1_9GLOM|nr:9519_t:CDS:1 [Paraglomus occultum]